MAKTVINPGDVIGIIGGGQLGRMLSQAAVTLGYKTHIFCPDEDSPASQVADFTTVAEYEDKDALKKFAESVNVVTFEFENIPVDSLELLEENVAVRPSAKWLYLCRNRVREKSFINEQGIGTARFTRVTSEEELQQAMGNITPPAILKTTEFGYDGKGQAAIASADEAVEAWRSLNTSEAILEEKVDFELEISVIVARNLQGEIECFPPAHNIHTNHILDRSIVPAPIDATIAKKAEEIAVKLAEAGGLVGLLAVEMFVTRDGEVLVNELAPRPHNSGHWTMDACTTSQFEQLTRAICGLPLGSTEILHLVEMKNLIGDEVKLVEQYKKQSSAHVHLYGKKETRQGRKMGHVNFLKSRN